MNAADLRDLIIIPTLDRMGLRSDSAVALLLGTAAQESHLGFWRRQMGGGPAIGIYQMETETHDDCWGSFLVYRKELSSIVRGFLPNSGVPDASLMENDDAYATAMARVKYLRISAPLPSADDPWALGAYWKKNWNTEFGAGTVEEFVSNWDRYISKGGAA